MLHSIAHKLGMNGGRVVTARDANDRLWVGFKCSGCGKVQCAEPSKLFAYIAVTKSVPILV